MLKMKTLVIVILFSLALNSCRKIETASNADNPDLIGNWVNPEYSDSLITYTKAEKLTENEFGFTFNAGNTLICRQNSGWCGTPPISTADYNGSWSLADSIVKISVGYWGGTADIKWRIIKLEVSKLEISVISSEYHPGK